MTIPTVTPEAARLTVTGLMNQIHELMDQDDFRAWEVAAAKALEAAQALARASHYIEANPVCPVLRSVVSGAEIDSHNKLIQRSAS